MTKEEALALARSRSETAMRRLAQQREKTTQELRAAVERKQAAKVGTDNANACARTGERE